VSSLSTVPVGDRARALHERSIVIDGLCGSALEYEPLIQGGLSAGNCTLGGDGDIDFDTCLKSLVEYFGLVDAASDRVSLVTRPEQIAEAKQRNRFGVILGIQGSNPVAKDADRVEILYRLGVRVFQLTYNLHNRLAVGCLEPNDTGLTYFGIQAVRTMNRVGALIDLSHASEKTVHDTCRVSTAPVVISHANARALNPNPRCLTDDSIRAVAQTGGVIGISAYASFAEVEKGVWPDISAWAKHVRYVSDLVGPEHVGIGTDKFEDRRPIDFLINWQRKYPDTYSGYSSHETRAVQGLPSLAYMPRLTQGLVDAGFSDGEITGILGGNFMRLFGQVWK
jgi:membrane dipeptidase